MVKVCRDIKSQDVKANGVKVFLSYYILLSQCFSSIESQFLLTSILIVGNFHTNSQKKNASTFRVPITILPPSTLLRCMRKQQISISNFVDLS